MIFGREKILKDEIIVVGRKLYDLRLVVARSGNLSCRIDDKMILVTGTGTSLGSLTHDDIIKVDISQEKIENPRLTSEFPLHHLIYKKFPHKAIIHCHPPLVNAYFAVYSDLKALTFETKLCLGEVPVVAQETPSISKPELVVDSLKSNNIVVIKNHGVVSVGEKFSEALYTLEMLEEAVKTIAVARIFKRDIADPLDKEVREALSGDQVFLMFSPAHIQAIVELVNKDSFIAQKGQELDLTLKLAIKMDGLGKAYKFNFEKGRIVKLDLDDDAPFIISAPYEAWELVFAGKLDPFVATMQGKMKLKGELGKLSKWYVPFSRLFELFRQVPFK
ncbi:MAG: class II aldolase/adducin family protein [Candidatus Omnitrophica bacterium]|nr:class II aldolase/adducin family protein [Candidatus Omnitrophota bacterium]